MHWTIRWAWMLAIGWWLAILWLIMGLMLCFTVIFLPIGWKMIDSTYTILTLNVD